MSKSLNCTTLHKAFRERISYDDMAGNKRVQTGIDATVGFNNSKRVTMATNQIRISYVKHS